MHFFLMEQDVVFHDSMGTVSIPAETVRLCLENIG